MNDDEVRPMKYHAPGWTLQYQERYYQVWGAGPVLQDGVPSGKYRDHWSASYTGKADMDADFTSASTLQDVLLIFPLPVQHLFQEAIGV